MSERFTVEFFCDDLEATFITGVWGHITVGDLQCMQHCFQDSDWGSELDGLESVTCETKWQEGEDQSHPGNPAFINHIPGYWEFKIIKRVKAGEYAI